MFIPNSFDDEQAGLDKVPEDCPYEVNGWCYVVEITNCRHCILTQGEYVACEKAL